MSFLFVVGLLYSPGAIAFEAPPSLHKTVLNLEEEIEEKFRPLGTIHLVRFGSDEKKTIQAIKGFQDSAYLTGIYLASQCLHHATLGPFENSKKLHIFNRIKSILEAIEYLFKVPGKPGAMARSVVDPIHPVVQRLRIYDDIDVKNSKRWRWGKGEFKDWKWAAETSRDQITGIFFGLETCRKTLNSHELNLLIEPLILSTVLGMKRNSWSIPLGLSGGVLGSNKKVTGIKRLAWLQMARDIPKDAKIKEELDHEWDKVHETCIFYSRCFRFTFLNNFYQYYAWLLRYLRFYTLFLYGSDETTQENLRYLFLERVWKHTWNYKNSFFIFVKLATVGETDLQQDLELLELAKTQLRQLAQIKRIDLPNGKEDLRKNTQKSRTVQWIGGILSILPGLDINSNNSKHALDIRERPSLKNYWEDSPFRLDENGNTGFSYPPVDMVVAYWLGRYHGLIGPSE